MASWKSSMTVTETAGEWQPIDDSAFIRLIGPFYYRTVPAGIELRFPVDERHQNRAGIVQGGAVATFIDRSLGMGARWASHARYVRTINLDIQFINSVHAGQTIFGRPAVQRVTPRLAFMTGIFEAGDRVVATAGGVFRLDAKNKPGQGPRGDLHVA
ncbi:MAG: PaaI family thioesterase [Mesorhizobium sp.]|nr:MAG: PaaI family thioesterase [Mesorhizobium sp.]